MELSLKIGGEGKFHPYEVAALANLTSISADAAAVQEAVTWIPRLT